MACENPLRMMNPRYKKMAPDVRLSYSRSCFGMDTPPDYYIEVPCGCCQACEKRRMFDFRVRLMYEHAAYPNSAFITLTFNDENLQRFKDDPNKAVRLFLDRARKFYGKGLRHWIVAEYGTLNGRIHYHGLLFNTPPKFNAERLASLWDYGYVWLGYANPETVKYITKYVTKSASCGKKPPRIITSKGIGESYISPETVRFHISDDNTLRPYIHVGGVKFPLPRYYYGKIFTDDLKLQMVLDRFYNPPEKFYCNGREYTNELEYIQARKALFDRNLSLGLSKDYHKERIKRKKLENGTNKNSERL